MPFGLALIGGAGSLASGLLGSNAAGNAASAASQAQQNALNFEKGVYNTAQTNLSPNISTGQNALYSLGSLYGLNGGTASNQANAAFQNYTQTPGYQFPLQQGELAVNRQLASQGLTDSGAQSKDLNNYAQGYASQGFGNYANQLQQLAGMGQNAALGLGGIGSSAGSQVAGSSTALGAANMGGILGQNSALQSSLTNGLTALAQSPTAQSQTSFSGSPIGQLVNKL